MVSLVLLTQPLLGLPCNHLVKITHRAHYIVSVLTVYFFIKTFTA